MLPVFYTVNCAILYCAAPPYTACWATLHCANLYLIPMLNAACFGAMSVGVPGEPSLGYPLHCIYVESCLFYREERRRV